MKKILFILPSLAGGGAERVVCNLINSIDKKTFKCDIFLFKNDGVYFNLLPNHINVFYGSENKISYIKIIYELYKISKDYDILVGAMELMPTYMACIVASLRKKKKVGWVHININSLLIRKSSYIRILHDKFLIKFFYNKLDYIIGVSNGAAENIKKYLTVENKRKVGCIYNPIDIEFVDNKSNELLDKDNIIHPMVIAVGRLEKQKNYKLLLKAWNKCVDEGINGKLVILGDGSCKNELKMFVKKLGLDDTVEFMGFVSNPFKYMKTADVLALTSYFEGLPTVLIESMIVGTPVVAVDCPDGVSEILNNGEYGILKPVGDVDGIAAGIMYIIKNPNIAHEYINKGRKSLHRFDKFNVTKKFEKLFTEI